MNNKIDESGRDPQRGLVRIALAATVLVAVVALIWWQSKVDGAADDPRQESTHDGLESGPVEEGNVDPRAAGMPALLARMNAAAGPEDDPFRNTLQLERLRNLPTPSTFEGRLERDLALAGQELLAGELESAIERYERARSALQASSSDNASNMQRIGSLLAVAQLRLGELENCALRHHAQSCIFPIRSAGVHEIPRGSEGAIVELSQLLAREPDDLQSRWLLNIAHMTLGSYPDAVPAEYLIPPERFESETEFPRFRDRAPDLGTDIVGLAGGSVTEDFDGDGDLDILASSWGSQDPLRYLRNDQHRGFVEASEAAGLTGQVGGLNLVQADYDNDGDIDVLVLRGAWTQASRPYPNSLLRNRGDGRFDDVTEAAGLLSFHPTQSAAWGDYDNDGWLDLFVANENPDPYSLVHPSKLYHNDGTGGFREVTAEVGIDKHGFNKAAVWGDYDNDGRPDLFVSQLGGANQLWHNEGPGENGTWRFVDRAKEAGVTQPILSFPAFFFDYDNDGWQDLFVGGYGHPGEFVSQSVDGVISDYLDLPNASELPRLYRNLGDGRFEDRTESAGLDRRLLPMGLNHGDLDGDGYLDFYLGTGAPDYRALVPNVMFRNDSGKRFQDVTTVGGFGHLQKGHAISFADLDNDGDEDIHAVMGGAYEGDFFQNILFENPGTKPSWLVLRLEGRDANRAALGARVTVELDGPSGRRELHRTVTSGGSFGGNSLQLEIGLGDATRVEGVRVTWPGAQESERYEGLVLQRAYRLRQGDEQARLEPYERIQWPEPGSIESKHEMP